ILDIRLSKLALSNGCSYSRYADDITFSTNKNQFPDSIVINENSNELGPLLVNEIEKAGFKINNNKTRILRHTSRQ
ncbi:reverse transcriptase domain-containing protein, partial [Escherichia coli]